MKKIISLLVLPATIILSIMGCSSEEQQTVKNDSTVQEAQNTPAIEDESKEVEKDDKVITDSKEKDLDNENKDSHSKTEEEINKSDNQSKDSEASDKNYLTEVKIYLVDGNLTTLKRFVKPVKVTDKKVATAALQALKDNNIEGYESPIPSEVSFNDINIENGVATVKYTNSGEGGLGTAGESAFISSIVYTLTEFPTVESVNFDSQGTPSIIAHMDQGSNFNRDNIGNYLKVLN